MKKASVSPRSDHGHPGLQIFWPGIKDERGSHGADKEIFDREKELSDRLEHAADVTSKRSGTKFMQL